MNAPETIWLADPENAQEMGRKISSQHNAFGLERPLIKYRRADLPPTDAQIMAHPKVKALVEALQYIYDNGDGYDGRSMARDALAAMEPPHE